MEVLNYQALDTEGTETQSEVTEEIIGGLLKWVVEPLMHTDER